MEQKLLIDTYRAIHMTALPKFHTVLVGIVLTAAAIALSDRVLVSLVQAPDLPMAMTLKSCLFVIGGGLLLYLLIKRRLPELLSANRPLGGDRESLLKILQSLMKMCRKDLDDHSDRVATMVVGLATLAGVRGPALRELKVGAMLRDVGNLAIPEANLGKQTRLSSKETALVRRHTQIGRDLLEQAAFSSTVIDIAHAHHERWDGFGYPCGLAGEAIPLAARIVSIVDVWGALGSDREYREAWPEARILAYLRQGAGGQFDPRLTALFLANYDRLKGSITLQQASSGARQSAAFVARDELVRQSVGVHGSKVLPLTMDG